MLLYFGGLCVHFSGYIACNNSLGRWQSAAIHGAAAAPSLLCRNFEAVMQGLRIYLGRVQNSAGTATFIYTTTRNYYNQGYRVTRYDFEYVYHIKMKPKVPKPQIKQTYNI